MDRILIVDASEQWQSALSQVLGRDHLLACCCTGQQAIELAVSFRPDVLILDLMLPGNDGLSVLQNLSTSDLSPCIITTSRYYSNYLLRALDRYRVDYAMMKPCTADAVADRVSDLLSQRNPGQTHQLDPYDQVSVILRSLDVPTSQSGFRYLRDGILLLMQDPNQQLTKSLYPAIAALHGSNPIAVEKAIRTAINTAWVSRRESEWKRYFRTAPNGVLPKPTSGHFMARIADALACRARRQA